MNKQNRLPRDRHAHIRAIEEMLVEVVEEANKYDWDGYGALPVNDYSLSHAFRFLKALPLLIPLPEVCVDPDGEVSFDWYNELNDSFSISISETGKLSFAGILGENRVHGVTGFYGKVPPIISNYIQQLLSN